MGSEHTIEEARAAREARLDALHERTIAAVEGLVTGIDWIRAMELTVRFRSRSFGNVMLIQSQHEEAFREGRVPNPSPTLVAGFQQWKKLGRSVAKGQAGYMINGPVTARFSSSTPSDPTSWRRLAPREASSPGEIVRSRLVGVKPVFVWDVSQTHGAPIPSQPMPVLLRGEAPAGLWDGLADQVREAGFDLKSVANSRALDGANCLTDFIAGTVSVRADMDPAARTKTLAHELAHVVLRQGSDVAGSDGPHRGIGEVQAESVALLITATHGMDSSGYTIPYVSGWATTVPGTSPVDVVRNTGERVRSAAMAILDRLPDPPTPDGSVIGLEPSLGTSGRIQDLDARPRARPSGPTRTDEGRDF